MKIIGLEDSRNPVFNSVTGLSNINYDNSNIRSGQMATEDQIRQLWIDANDLEQRIDHCCRDIVVWKSYVRVIAENTNIVMSDWLDNVAVGTTRRGVPFTIEFALPHDSTKFFDDRSGNEQYTKCFNVQASIPGKAAQLQTVFTNNAISCAYDSSTSPNNSYCLYGNKDSGLWISSSGTQLSAGFFYYSGENPLPRFNIYQSGTTYSYHPGNVYYTYKDSTDNKIKIDVKRRDQFADGEYLALFFTQFVLRNGATL